MNWRPGGVGRLLAVLLAATMALGLLTGCRSAGPGPATTTGGGAPSAGAAAGLAPARATTDLPTITVAALPRQAVQTLELIAVGGPFPYSKDGATFSNREALLPSQPRGFYSEYTVVTPGSRDRGARRIVAGDDGSRFYTSDHYASFREVITG